MSDDLVKRLRDAAYGQLPTTMVPGGAVPFMNVGDMQR